MLHARPSIAVALACVVVAASVGTGSGASSSVTVTMDVTSATTLDASGCAAGSSSVAFGTVLPGSGAVTGPCAIRFGSTNDAAALRLGQVDRRGAAMFRPFHGALDAGFATGGDYVLDHSAGADHFWSGVELPDGDILLAGRYLHAVGDRGTLLVRLNPDGTGHVGFGTSGIATRNIRSGADDSVPWTLEGLPDGTAILGTHDASDAPSIARVLADGTLDATWASGATFATIPGWHAPRNVRRTSAGDLVVQGTKWPSPTSCNVSRFTSAGVLDTTYGTNGSTSVAGSSDSYCDGMDVDSRGRAVVAGSVGYTTALLFRLTEDGRVDTTFGGGIREYDPAGTTTSELFDVDVRPDDGVVVSGIAGGLLLAEQYGSDGAVDASFGGGSVSVAGQSWGGREVRWMDGRIVLAGDYGNGRIMRLLPDGMADTSFSDDGIDDPPVPGTTEDNGLIVLGDGRALLYGEDGTSAQARMYDAEALPQHATGTTDWNDGGGFFGACLASVSGAGTATWTPGSCTQADGAWWNDVAAVPETVATSPSGDDSIVASVHFGVRVPAGQARGAYVAPLAVEVVAPAA